MHRNRLWRTRIHREIARGMSGITQEARATIGGRGSKKGCPGALGPICLFKLLFESALDLEPPKDYKHNLPVSTDLFSLARYSAET